jgi:hypothetical protein
VPRERFKLADISAPNVPLEEPVWIHWESAWVHSRTVRSGATIAALIVVCTAFGASTSDWQPRGPALHGDVDGDGQAERVVIEYRGRPSCDFRLIAGSLVARVRPEICNGKPGELYSGPDPHVAVLVNLDGRPGLEIVVQLGHGAHTEFADLWAIRNRRLRRFAGPEPHLSYGGSVGTGSHVVDCARRPGLVLMSTQVYRPPARVIRRWYRVRALRLRLVRTRSLRWPSDKPVTLREFRSPQPFPSCAQARAAG